MVIGGAARHAWGDAVRVDLDPLSDDIARAYAGHCGVSHSTYAADLFKN